MPTIWFQARAAIISTLFVTAAFWTSLLSVQHFWWALLPCALACELAVWPALWLRKYRRFNASHRAPPSAVDPRAVFERFTTQQAKLSKYICIKKMLRMWYGDAPLDSIKRGNVADLLCYGFWYKSPAQLAADGQADLPEQLVTEIEAAWGVSFPEGRDASLPFMSHLWQDVRCDYRPMLFYVGIEVLFALKHVLLLGTGFRTSTLDGVTYYCRGLAPKAAPGSISSGSVGGGGGTPKAAERGGLAPKAADSGGGGSGADTTPILFFHGIGLGLLPYLTFVWRLASTGHPVVAVECNHLGMRWVDSVPTEDDVVDVIVRILDAEAVPAVAVVAHSYGTFMASRLVQRRPDKVQSLALIDPVCFVMYSGKLILNFVYQPHNKAITTGIVARDIHHATSVCRNFFWSLLNLWPDQLPAKTLVVLSGQDELVPVAEVIRMLEEESSAHLLYHDHHTHAEFIKDLTWQDRVVDRVARMASCASAPDGASDPSDAVDHTGEQLLTGLDMEHSILPESRAITGIQATKMRRHARGDNASSYESCVRLRELMAQETAAAAAAVQAVPTARMGQAAQAHAAGPAKACALRMRHKHSSSSSSMPAGLSALPPLPLVPASSS
ncbi:hypothetical protein FOA52_003058 [Chlamydomonas sp. UWO 241]|nr:hypothetical protein FOA52_003058 [Chlamydomonas sp. UWO 241]